MNRIEAGNTNPSSFLVYTIAQKLEIELPELYNFKPGISKKQLLIIIYYKSPGTNFT